MMKGIEIKKASNKNVLELVRENKDFNLKTKNGAIYMVGGILCKTIGTQSYYYDLKLKCWREL
jgi:hypothetical protein